MQPLLARETARPPPSSRPRIIQPQQSISQAIAEAADGIDDDDEVQFIFSAPRRKKKKKKKKPFPWPILVDIAANTPSSSTFIAGRGQRISSTSAAPSGQNTASIRVTPAPEYTSRTVSPGKLSVHESEISGARSALQDVQLNHHPSYANRVTNETGIPTADVNHVLVAEESTNTRSHPQSAVPRTAGESVSTALHRKLPATSTLKGAPGLHVRSTISTNGQKADERLPKATAANKQKVDAHFNDSILDRHPCQKRKEAKIMTETGIAPHLSSGSPISKAITAGDDAASSMSATSPNPPQQPPKSRKRKANDDSSNAGSSLSGPAPKPRKRRTAKEMEAARALAVASPQPRKHKRQQTSASETETTGKDLGGREADSKVSQSTALPTHSHQNTDPLHILEALPVELNEQIQIPSVKSPGHPSVAGLQLPDPPPSSDTGFCTALTGWYDTPGSSLNIPPSPALGLNFQLSGFDSMEPLDGSLTTGLDLPALNSSSESSVASLDSFGCLPDPPSYLTLLGPGGDDLNGPVWRQVWPISERSDVGLDLPVSTALPDGPGVQSSSTIEGAILPDLDIRFNNRYNMSPCETNLVPPTSTSTIIAQSQTANQGATQQTRTSALPPSARRLDPDLSRRSLYDIPEWKPLVAEVPKATAVASDGISLDHPLATVMREERSHLPSVSASSVSATSVQPGSEASMVSNWDMPALPTAGEDNPWIDELFDMYQPLACASPALSRGFSPQNHMPIAPMLPRLTRDDDVARQGRGAQRDPKGAQAQQHLSSPQTGNAHLEAQTHRQSTTPAITRPRAVKTTNSTLMQPKQFLHPIAPDLLPRGSSIPPVQSTLSPTTPFTADSVPICKSGPQQQRQKSSQTSPLLVEALLRSAGMRVEASATLPTAMQSSAMTTVNPALLLRSDQLERTHQNQSVESTFPATKTVADAIRRKAAETTTPVSRTGPSIKQESGSQASRPRQPQPLSAPLAKVDPPCPAREVQASVPNLSPSTPTTSPRHPTSLTSLATTPIPRLPSNSLSRSHSFPQSTLKPTHAQNMLVDIAQTAQLNFPFELIAERHKRPVKHVYEAFSAAIQIPLLRCATDKRRCGRLGIERGREYRSLVKEVETAKGKKEGPTSGREPADKRGDGSH